MSIGIALGAVLIFIIFWVISGFIPDALLQKIVKGLLVVGGLYWIYRHLDVILAMF